MAKIKARAKLVENVRSIADNQRTHSVVLDLGTASGGNDTGPSALELCLMALADCAVVICADVAKNSKVQLTNLEVYAEADKFPDSPVISNVSMRVNLAGKARKEILQALWRRTEANCPVLFVFKEQIPVKVELETTPQ